MLTNRLFDKGSFSVSCSRRFRRLISHVALFTFACLAILPPSYPGISGQTPRQDKNAQAAADDREGLKTVSDRLTATPRSLEVLSGETVSIPLGGENLKANSTVKFSIVSNPNHGTLSPVTLVDGLSGKVSYTATAGFTGVDSFVYQIIDGNEVGAPAEVKVAVTTARTEPAAEAETAPAGTYVGPVAVQSAQPSSVPDSSARLSVNAAASSAGVGSTSSSGAVTRQTIGPRSTTGVSVTNGAVTSSSRPVSVHVVAASRSLKVVKGGSLSVPLSAEVVGEIRPVTFAIILHPSHGSLSAITTTDGSNGSVVYTPTAGFGGMDTFTYRASDGTHVSAPAQVRIIVSAPAAVLAPQAMPQTFTFIQGGNGTITLMGSDPAALPLTFAISMQPAHGTLTNLTNVSPTTGTVVYTANTGFTGQDQFAFTVNNGTVVSPAAVVTVLVTPLAVTGPTLTAAEVDQVVRAAATLINNLNEAVAVVDRAGRILAVYRKTNATDASAEQAVSLARTGAFFSNNQAPLSSRTVRFISGNHFPMAIPFTPNGQLYGIELTNRGCGFNATFNVGQAIPPSTNIAGTGPGLGITTGKVDLFDSDLNAVNAGGFPIFKAAKVAGGVGVSGVDFPSAEFASFNASVAVSGFGPVLLPPGVIFADGIALPFVVQKTAPSGTTTGNFSDGKYQITPIDGGTAPEGYLVGPKASADGLLSAADVDGIVQNAIAEANITRAAIRLPIGVPAKMVIAVADLQGNLLALFRMQDSTIFSVDVAVAKSRNVVYFSGPNLVAADLPGVPVGTAVTNRTVSFGAQSLYPPGIDGTQPGPFFPLFVQDATHPCTQGSQPKNANQNGIVFFPGSEPLYRGGKLIGGLGISGDGVNQDDVVTAGGAAGFESSPTIRADQIIIRNVRLPFLKFDRQPNIP